LRVAARFGRVVLLAAPLLAAGSQSLRAATFTVTNTGDSGAGSLRQAILNANATPAADLIAFRIPGAGLHTISPTSALPTITSPVTIDGNSQSAFQAGSSIELSGAKMPPGSDGLHVTGGASTIQGLTINGLSPELFGGGGNGIVLENGGGNAVFHCAIGTNPAGTARVGSGGTGILISNSSSNVIGSLSVPPSPPGGNVIGGNFIGISISGAGSSGNVVQGNRIGVAPGTNPNVANSSDGLVITNASQNEVLQNSISGNGGNGVSLSGGATENVVHFNVVSSNHGDGVRKGVAGPAVLLSERRPPTVSERSLAE